MKLLKAIYKIDNNINNIFLIRQIIINNNNINNTDNNNKQCFYCLNNTNSTNIKLRQIFTNARISDEIIMCKFICDNCYNSSRLRQ